MSTGIWMAASGASSQITALDATANNLANATTVGYKAEQAVFQEHLIAAMYVGRAQKDMRYNGVATVASDMRSGPLQVTNKPLDVAIEGDGFFQLERPDGRTAYTRDGSFTLSDSGAIVTSDGYALAPGVTVPPDTTEITISTTGTVSAASGNGNPVEIGRIEMARVLNPNGLLSIGENQYVETAASGEPITGFPQDQGFGRLVQGSLEASNVEIVQEMTDMIAAQRAYEINAKAIRTGEEMMQATNDIVR